MNIEQQTPTQKRRVIVAITGASGSIYGIRLLELMRPLSDVETHLVISRAGRLTLTAECDCTVAEVEALADVVHAVGNIGAPPSSGSFRVHGMLIAPCSIRTASNIATGNTGELISRAADVMLKERRLLVIAIRETPLHAGHLETLTKLAQLGAVIFPPVPSFYHRPQGLADLVDQTCMRILDQIGVTVETAPRWGEAGGIRAIGAHDTSSRQKPDA
ncbi:MAG: UbiX family flavin prenyltransferase [Candidatus Tectomicrobia bacterium]